MYELCKQHDPDLGPWTSQLDSASPWRRAYWRRRLHRLGRLQTDSPRQRRVAWQVAVCAVLFGCIPLVRWTSAEPQVEADRPDDALQESSQSTDQAAEASPYSYTFANGATVELIGIAPHPWDGKPWWKPNGEALPQPPCDANPTGLIGQPGDIVLQLCWRWNGEPEDIQPRVSVVPGLGTTGALDATRQGRKVDGLVNQAIVIDKADEADIQFSMTIHPTPWETIFETSARGSTTRGGSGPNDRSFLSILEPKTIEGSTVVAVSYHLPKYAQVRFSAKDSAGNVVPGMATSSGSTTHHTMAEYQFAGVSPDDLATWVVQGRNYTLETVVFQRVSLHAGHRTQVRAMEQERLP